MIEKLELLALGGKYKVEKDEVEDAYNVIDHECDLCAFIPTDGAYIEYYRTGCYNACTEWLDIDMDALMDLKAFCELMVN